MAGLPVHAPEIQLAGGHFDFRNIRHRAVADTPHKARIAQSQHRHQTHEVASRVVNIVERERTPFAIKETAQRQDATVIRTLALQTIENTVIVIVTGRPAGFQRTIAAHPMTARLRFTKSKNNM